MYSLIQEVWPDNEKIVEKFSNNSEHVINCDDIMDHIENCEICKKKIYIKYKCIGNKIVLSKEDKEYIRIFLIGILIILVLQLFNKSN